MRGAKNIVVFGTMFVLFGCWHIAMEACGKIRFEIPINNQKIYWIDAKYWFVSRQSSMLFRGFVASVKKYTTAHGPGAVVCGGFEQNAHQVSTIRQYNVTLLDASRAQTKLLLQLLD
eukprot:16740_1